MVSPTSSPGFVCGHHPPMPTPSSSACASTRHACDQLVLDRPHSQWRLRNLSAKVFQSHQWERLDTVWSMSGCKDVQSCQQGSKLRGRTPLDHTSLGTPASAPTFLTSLVYWPLSFGGNEFQRRVAQDQVVADPLQDLASCQLFPRERSTMITDSRILLRVMSRDAPVC